MHGQLAGLAEPSSDRFKLPLEVALQRDLDSVVVDSEATAKACLAAIAARGKPLRLEFLPLSFLKVRHGLPRAGAATLLRAAVPAEPHCLLRLARTAVRFAAPHTDRGLLAAGDEM